jgi:type IV pilus assembly protein PilC
MPTYNWEGKSKLGEVKRGELVAENVALAKLQLRKQQIFPTRIREKRDLVIKKFSLRRKIPEKAVVVFTRQFATMINAGLPLVQCLNILASQQENPALYRVITQMRKDVESGLSLTEAMKKHPKVFNDLYTNLVEAGEAGGVLDDILTRLSSHIEKSLRLKKKVKGALIYPAVVVGVAIAVMAIILIFVIPVFEKMFAEFGHSLPAPTRFVIGLSRFLTENFFFFLAGFAVLIFFIRRFYKTERGKHIIDDLTLKVPIFGTLLRKVAVANFTRTFGTMISSGVPILEAMDIVARSSGNKIVEKAILKARESIAQGRTISEPLEESGVFPPMVTQMIQVGEASGELDTMLNKIADYYDEDVDATINALTSMMEPVLMIILGGLVGGLVISMYLPIFKIGEAITG